MTYYFQFFFSFLGVALGVAGLFLLARNWFVFRVRSEFIDQPPHLQAYLSLPSYDGMMLNPRYWLLWTKAQWDKWLETQS